MKKISRLMILTAVMLLIALSAVSVYAAEEKTDAVKLMSGEYMTAKTINYSSTKKNDGTWISTSGGTAYTVYSISAGAAGKLYVDAYADSSNTYGASIVVGTVSGDQITYNTSYTGYVSAGNTQYGIGCYDVKKGGTYYVGIKSSAAAYAQVTAYVIPYSTRSLAAGKTMIASSKKGSSNADSSVLFKIKPKKSGSVHVGLKVYGASSSGGYVTLLNSKKKAVSKKLYYNSDSKYSYVVFGVKKGTTYYLKVTDCYGYSSEQYAYGIKYTLKSASLKKNTKKSKAITLKRKAKAKSIVRVASNKSMKQWYKFKVSKTRETVFTIDASKVKSGSAKYTIYCGKKKLGSRDIVNGNIHKISITYSTRYGYAKKGTYYVCISTPKKTSGVFKVRYSK